MFEIIEGEALTDGVERVKSYGLRTPSGKIINDITTKKKQMFGFIQKLNLWGICEIHILDLVYDFIN